MNSQLRYIIFNGVTLCPRCHKFGRKSFHNSFIATYLFFNRPERKNQLKELLICYNIEFEVTKEYLKEKIDELQKEIKSSPL